MITLHGHDNNTIQLSLTNIIHEFDNNMYLIEMPTIMCNNKRHADYIRKEVNAFVNEISKKTLEE